MPDRIRVGIVGASGFVGSAVALCLGPDALTIPIRAPRLRTDAHVLSELLALAEATPRVELVESLKDCAVVVNAAGDPDASSTDKGALLGANALLPAVILQACREAGVTRLIHLSSAVVQNDRHVLDSSEDMQPFSAYSLSKCLGERALRDSSSGEVQVIRFRPPSVHHASRRVSRGVSRIAGSPLASVAGDGSQPSPQALLDNVASAVAFMVLTPEPIPSVVHYPWEGLSAQEVMTIFGMGRRPHHLPASGARLLVRSGKTLGRIVPSVAANARRAEILWFGQAQAISWLETAGWRPPLGRDAWETLARDLVRPAQDLT